MAYFGAPRRSEKHAERALKCALAMQERLKIDNQSREGDQILTMGIGIHTGSAIVGEIGPPQRREYTVIGDNVNVASRIEQLTKRHEAEILLSEEARSKISDGSANLRPCLHR